jgi:hypothetical protein
LATSKEKDPSGQADHARERLKEFLRNRAPQDGAVTPIPPEDEEVPKDESPAPPPEK